MLSSCIAFIVVTDRRDQVQTQVCNWLDSFGLMSHQTSIILHTDDERSVGELVGRSSKHYLFQIRRAAPQQHRSIGGAERGVRKLKEGLSVLRSDLNKQGYDVRYSFEGLRDCLTYLSLMHNHFGRAGGTNLSPLETSAGRALSKPTVSSFGSVVLAELPDSIRQYAPNETRKRHMFTLAWGQVQLLRVCWEWMVNFSLDVFMLAMWGKFRRWLGRLNFVSRCWSLLRGLLSMTQLSHRCCLFLISLVGMMKTCLVKRRSKISQLVMSTRPRLSMSWKILTWTWKMMMKMNMSQRGSQLGKGFPRDLMQPLMRMLRKMQRELLETWCWRRTAPPVNQVWMHPAFATVLLARGDRSSWRNSLSPVLLPPGSVVKVLGEVVLLFFSLLPSSLLM